MGNNSSLPLDQGQHLTQKLTKRTYYKKIYSDMNEVSWKPLKGLKWIESHQINVVLDNIKNLKSPENWNRKRCPKMQSVQIILCPPISDGIKAFTCYAYKLFKDLQKLDIIFPDCKDRSVQKLASIVRKFKNLKQLSLTFKNGRITNKSLKSIASIKIFLQNLESFSVALLDCREINDQGIEIFTREVKNPSNKLNHFKFSFHSMGSITEKGLQLIGSMTQRISKLRTFEIEYSGCTLTIDKSFEYFTAQPEGNFTNLHKLSFKFHQMNSDGKKFILGKSLINLKVLNLNFHSSNLPENSLKILGFNIAEKLPSLKDLYLNFTNCKNITDSGVETLGFQVCRSSAQIVRLTLIFNGCAELTDKVMSILGYCLSQLGEKLKLLALDFAWCKKITNEGLNLFSKNTKNSLAALKVLTFGFRGCLNISERGLEYLGSQIQKCFLSLEQVCLDFHLCYQISLKDIENLANFVTKRKAKLQKLLISFGTFEPEISWDNLDNILLSIPHVELCC